MSEVVFFTPGPSKLYSGVREDLETCLRDGVLSQSHRGSAFKEGCARTKEKLRELFCVPEDYTVLFVGSGTEAMEVLVRNLSSRSTFHVCMGAFSRRFQEIAKATGRHTHEVSVEPGRGVPLDRVEVPDAELLCVTHNETSTGVELDLGGLASFRAKRPGALIAVDIVSSACTRVFPWSLAEAWFFSVQKACGLPAGLGVMILGPRALERAKFNASEESHVGYFRSLVRMDQKAQTHQTVETPNVLGIHLLGRVFERMIDGGGMAEITRSTREKMASLCRWAEAHPQLSLFVEDPKERSQTVLVLNLPKGSHGGDVRAILEGAGLVVGAGYGASSSSQIRIANFPAHTIAEHDRLRGELDRVLATN